MKNSTVFLRAAKRMHEGKVLGACAAIKWVSDSSPRSAECCNLLEDLFRSESPYWSSPYWLGYVFMPESKELRVYALLMAAEWAKDEE